MTRGYPTSHMLSPGSVITGLSRHKAMDELLDWILIADQLPLALEMILRHSHIPRIANNVDDTRVARVEIVVALDNPRPRNAKQVTIASSVGSRDDPIDV